MPMPGGGPGGPQLSADGRTVIFVHRDGQLRTDINTVPFRGGPERDGDPDHG